MIGGWHDFGAVKSAERPCSGRSIWYERTRKIRYEDETLDNLTTMRVVTIMLAAFKRW